MAMEGASLSAPVEPDLLESTAGGQRKRLFNPIKSLKRLFGLHTKKGSEDHGSGVGIRAKSASDMQQACSSDDTSGDIRSTSHLTPNPISRSTDCIYSKEVSFFQTGLALPCTTWRQNKLHGSSHALPAAANDDWKSLSVKSVDHSLSVVDASSAVIATSNTLEPGKNNELLPTDALPIDGQNDDEVFFDSKWKLTTSAADDPIVSESCMTLNDADLSAVSASVGRGLDGQAAMHKRAVRPRNRRTMSVYQPYLPSVPDNRANKNEIRTEKIVIHLDQDLLTESTDSTKHQESCSVEPTTKLTSSNAVSGQPLSIEVKLRQKTSSCNASSRAASRRRYTTEIPRSIFACIAEASSAKQSSAVEPISPLPIPVSSSPSEKAALSEFEQVFSKIHRRLSQNSPQDIQAMESSIGDVVSRPVASKTADAKYKVSENLSTISRTAKNGAPSPNPVPPGKEDLKPTLQKSTVPRNSQSKLPSEEPVRTNQFTTKHSTFAPDSSTTDGKSQLSTKPVHLELLPSAVYKAPPSSSRQSAASVNKPIAIRGSKDSSSSRACAPFTVADSQKRIIPVESTSSAQSASRSLRPDQKSTTVDPVIVATKTEIDKQRNHTLSVDDKQSLSDVRHANQNCSVTGSDKLSSQNAKQANQRRSDVENPPRVTMHESADVKEIGIGKSHSIVVKPPKEPPLPKAPNETRVHSNNRQQWSGNGPVHSRSNSMSSSFNAASQQRTVSGGQSTNASKSVKNTVPAAESAASVTAKSGTTTVQSSASHRSSIVRSASIANPTAIKQSVLEEPRARVEEPPWFALARQKTSNWTEGKV